MRPGIPGDAPALAEISATFGNTNIPLWALLSWWQRPLVWNYCSNGDFEDDVDGWSVAAVAGVTGAATSITRSTTAARNRYGGANGQVVCPATANTGTTYKINRRFYQGHEYIALLWVSSAAGSTAVRLRLGVSGDIASRTAGLFTTPTMYAVSWTPTADRDGAYVCFEITAATGTTLNIDGVIVFEARAATTTNSMATGDTSAVMDKIPEDWPAAPFLALISLELIRVEAIDPVTRTITMTRGQEGTGAGAYGSSFEVIPVPELRYHYEGKGAQPPVGVIEAESCDTTNLFTWAITADASKRLGNYLYKTGIGAGLGSVSADWLVDPHLLTHDDFTQGELAVEVWGRLTLGNGLGATNAILQAAPETATIASGVMTSNYGAIRYTEEYGDAGKSLVKPNSAESVRFVRLGTLTFPVDRSKPLRWRMQLRIAYSVAAAATIGLDYLMLVPLNGRCLGPTGKVLNTNYPRFIASATETTKVIRADLSGLVAKPPGAPQADHGLGGSLIELPNGNTDWLIKTSTLVPDDPTVDNTSELDGGSTSGSASVHIAVTPRGRLARSE